MTQKEPDFTPKFHIRFGKESFRACGISGMRPGGMKTNFTMNLVAQEAQMLIEQGFKIIRLSY